MKPMAYEKNSDIQESLNRNYERLKENPELSVALTVRLSAPLLLQIPQKWITASKKILVVGQETLDWQFYSGWYYSWPFSDIRSFRDFLSIENSVNAMIKAYEIFCFAREQPANYRSPFWHAYRIVRSAVGDSPDGFETSVLWTNLFRMALDGGSVLSGTLEEQDLIQDKARNMLSTEIEIMKPTTVIFFTGPRYDRALSREFSGLEFREVEDYSVRQISRLVHPRLPLSFRTYHPGYLNRGHWNIFEAVIRAANLLKDPDLIGINQTKKNL